MEEYVKTKGFLKDTIKMLNENIDDLETWSVHNEDKLNSEISELRDAAQQLERVANGKA